MRSIYLIALTLTIIGGINWGLVGLFDIDLVAKIFSGVPAISRVVYVAVGIASVVLASLSCGARKTRIPA
ncbi:MAG: DUF378 domain-containing protein [Burkholderiales bacterium]